jgi:hypothetical protein
MIPLPSAFKFGPDFTESTGGARWRLLPSAIEELPNIDLAG